MPNFSLLIDGGAGITVSDNLEDMTTYVLLEQEDWFEPEIKFVRSLAEPGTRAFDIGANHGVYAFSIAAPVAGAPESWCAVVAGNPDKELLRPSPGHRNAQAWRVLIGHAS